MVVEERAASGKIQQRGASQQSQRITPQPSAENGLLQVHRVTLNLSTLDVSTTQVVAYLVEKVNRVFQPTVQSAQFSTPQPISNRPSLCQSVPRQQRLAQSPCRDAGLEHGTKYDPPSIRTLDHLALPGTPPPTEGHQNTRAHLLTLARLPQVARGYDQRAARVFLCLLRCGPRHLYYSPLWYVNASKFRGYALDPATIPA